MKHDPHSLYNALFSHFRIVGMCLGEKAELIIPPEKGYGAKGAGANIPPNATLRFALDIVGINDEEIKGVVAPPNIFREMDTNGDNRISHDEMQAWFASKHPDRFTSIPPGLFERQDKNQVLEDVTLYTITLF